MKDSVTLDCLFPVDNGGSPIIEYEIEIWDLVTGLWKFHGASLAGDISPNCSCPHTLASTTYVVTWLKQVYANKAVYTPRRMRGAVAINLAVKAN